MTEIITTLPIAPRENPNLGYYSIFVVLSLLSKITHTQLIQGVNALGSKNIPEKTVTRHLEVVKNSSTSNVNIFLDNEKENFEIVLECFDIGIKQGWIVNKKVNIKCCNCGKCQFLKDAEDTTNGKGILDNNNCCKICTSEVILYENVDSFLLKIPVHNKPEALPFYLGKDIESHLNFFRGKEILLSRLIRGDLQVTLQSRPINIDVDFSWMCFLYRLQKLGYICNSLPFSSVSAKDITIGLIVSDLLQVDLPKLLIGLPYIKTNSESCNIRTDFLTNNYSMSEIKLFFSKIIGTKNKDMTLDINDLHRIKKLLNQFDSREILGADTGITSKDIWLNWNTQRYTQLFTKLQKRHGLDTYDKAILKASLL